MFASVRRHLLIVASSTILTLVLAEGVVLRGVLRYNGLSDLAIYERDIELGWTIVPNARGWHAALDFGLWLRSDEHGFRSPVDDGPAPPVPEGAQQILVLGDSFAFGWGVAADRMFSTELERQLSPRGRPYAVRTAAVPGYSTDQEYLQWRRLSTHVHPDRVVLLFHQSDPPGNIREWSDMGKFSYGKPRFDIANGRLALVNVPVPDKRLLAPDSALEPAKKLLRPLAMYAVLQSAMRNGIHLPAPRVAAQPVPVLDPAAYTVTAALLEALDADIRAHGATLFVALIPTEPVMTARLAEICHTLGIAFLDLQPAFANQTDVLLVHDGHWNAKGHAIAARAVAPFVR